jgi:hypothetical protein
MVATEVIHHQAGGHWSSIHLIVVPMGRDLLAVTALQGITLNAKIPLPDPAARARIDPIVDRRKVLNKLSRVGLARSGETSTTLPLRLPVSLTLALLACASSAYSNGIGRIEWMPSHTMGLGLATGGDRVPSEEVLSRSDRLEVRRVHAGGIPAEVVEMQSGGDLTTVALKVDAMRILHPSTLAHTTVAVNSHALPDPAACFVIDDVVDWREPRRPLVMTVDVADWFALDMPVLLRRLLGKRSRQAAATMAVTSIELAI